MPSKFEFANYNLLWLTGYDHTLSERRSRVDALRLPLIQVLAVDPVLAILLLFLFDAPLAFLALLTAVAHDFSPHSTVARPLPGSHWTRG
jgi:hypothetical protein